MDKDRGMSQSQFFNPISDLEKSDILSSVCRQKKLCIVKLLDRFYKVHFIKKNDQFIFIEKTNLFKVTQEKVIIQFEHQGDQYFFQSIASSNEDFFEVQPPEKMFKIQRRNDFRVTIPGAIRPELSLLTYPDLKTELVDISLGGIKLIIKTQFALEIVIDQLLSIRIKVMDFEESDLKVVVKFSQFNAKDKILTLGCQFNELDVTQTSTLRNTLIQIDRILRGKSDDDL